jgi:hypothetical protein
MLYFTSVFNRLTYIGCCRTNNYQKHFCFWWSNITSPINFGSNSMLLMPNTLNYWYNTLNYWANTLNYWIINLNYWINTLNYSRMFGKIIIKLFKLLNQYFKLYCPILKKIIIKLLMLLNQYFKVFKTFCKIILKLFKWLNP